MVRFDSGMRKINLSDKFNKLPKLIVENKYKENNYFEKCQLIFDIFYLWKRVDSMMDFHHKFSF